MTSDPDISRDGSSCSSNSKVKVTGQISRSPDENVPFSIEKVKVEFGKQVTAHA